MGPNTVQYCKRWTEFTAEKLQSNKKITIIFAAVVASLAAYFLLSLYYLPQAYLELPTARPEAVITNVTLSRSQISAGQSFVLGISGENRGDDADLQIVSVAFPSITAIDGVVKVMQRNFTQTQQISQVGDRISSGYSMGKNTTLAQYPFMEFSSRPWDKDRVYHAEMEITPPAAGNFTIFIKAVALPHNGELAHYPREGTRDQQNEFVQVYSVLVKQGGGTVQ